MTGRPASSGAARIPHEAGATKSPGTAGAPHVTGAPTSQGAVGIDPLTAPLTYPGTPPWRPAVLVTDAAVLALQPRDDAPLGEWLLQTDAADTSPDPISQDPAAQGAAHNDDGPDLQELSLDRYLWNAGCLAVASLVPVLAVGSNASPAQLRRKLAKAGLPTLVPITAVSVDGLAVGVSAHVSRPGYLPATPVPDEGAVSNLWLVWLDAAALAAVDLSRYGYLINEAGAPRRLTDQATLISALLAGIPGLPALGGTSPREWIERTHDPVVRDAIREAFRSAGLVRSAAGL
jgi:hypothetical protein